MNDKNLQNKTIDQQKDEVLNEAKSFEKSPWVFFVRKNKLTYLIIAFLVFFGFFTLGELPKELNPEVEIPIAIVVTAYPGASPTDVEQQVTKELETRIGEVSGIRQVDSTSSLGISSVIVEFEAGEDLNESINNLEDAVEMAQSELPEGAMDSQVSEINLDDQAILVATLSSNKYDISDLKQFAENIQDEWSSIPFVSDVKIVGGRERIVSIEANNALLAEKNISLQTIIGAISANNINFPIGSLELDQMRYSVRVSGKFESAEDVAKLQVGSVEGKPILLEDVAEVKEDFTEETSKSRLSINGNFPEESVSLQLFKKTGGDITAVTSEARRVLNEGGDDLYPEDLEVEVTRDYSVFIDESISTLVGNGAGTIVIILILLFIFLGYKEALIAGLSVPFSFFVAFIAMSVFGESLNTLSLFSLVLALGLLVDSAIVVVESMFNKVAKYKISGYLAAIATIKEYSAPLLSGMLTTVAAFLPLLFVEGIFGEFMRTIPIVVSSTLIAALFVSLTIVPSIGALVLNPQKNKNNLSKGWKSFFNSKPRSQRWSTKLFTKFSESYTEKIDSIIRSKKSRRLLIGGAWIMFFFSIALPMTGILKVQSFPNDDQDFFYVNVELPNGTELERTDEVIQRIEDILRNEPNIQNFVSSSGASFSLDIGGGGGSGSNTGFVEANLVDSGKRDETSGEIASRIRTQLEQEITNADIEVVEASSGPPTGDPVQLRVEGDDLVVLEDIGEEIKRELEAIPTTINVKTSIELSSGEIVFIPNYDLIVQNGLTVAQIGNELRNGISQNNDLNVSDQSGEETAILIGYKKDAVNTINDLKDIAFVNRSGEKIALSELGKVSIDSSLASIKRRDGSRVVTVSAGTEGGNPTLIAQELQQRIQTNVKISQGYKVIFGGEQEELQDTFQDMFTKMIIGVILILFILVAQFNSYKQVLIILFTIPLAMIGVLWGLTIAGLALDIPSFIGIVSLTGIVVNNAIILIDQINKEVAKGYGLIDSARQAGRKRFRPIILTTITTVFGLLPLSIVEPFWRNMGFSIIFGLSFSTFLTLFIIPTMYVSFHKKKIKM